MKMVLVEDFLLENYENLELVFIAKGDKKKKIDRPEIDRPGLCLAGFMKKFVRNRLLVFGTSELLYLKELSDEFQKERLLPLLSDKTPAVIVSGKVTIPKVLEKICHEKKISLLKTTLSTVEFLNRGNALLADVFAPTTSCHGTFIEVFGVGVLIQGDSSIGKSEAALGLVESGHRLISDDIVKLRLKKDSKIEGYGPELNKHMMEIRGIGLLNIAHLYGIFCVGGSANLDLIVKLEEWDDQAFYDRVGLDEKFIEMLGINVPYHILPVKPGRDVVLLIKTIVRNHLLKKMGYHSAKEFNIKLLETISQKQQKNEHQTIKKS